jgi:hypothetical protein
MSAQFPVESTPSTHTLERVVERTRKLLQGLGRSREIRARLQRAGLTVAEIRLGASLLDAVETAERAPALAETVEAQAGAAAQRMLATEGMAAVRAIRAALVRLEGPIAARVARAVDLEAPPAFAVRGLLRALEAELVVAGPEAAALDALLRQRGYDPARRAELMRQVEVALADVDLALPDDDARTAQDAAIRQARLALYRWHAEWSTVARGLIKSRRDLITLGLAKQRRRAAADADEDADESTLGVTTGTAVMRGRVAA